MRVAEARDNDIILRIDQDECGFNPRVDFDNLGTMICWHSRYDLGDKHEFDSPDDFQDWLKDNPSIVLPLYLYDHSGLRIKVGSFQGLLPEGHAEFDSMQVGWLYCTHERALSECKYGEETDEETLEKAKGMLEDEVKLYDQYLRGDVYAFSIVRLTKCGECGHETEEHIDSCCGFYGDDWDENGMMEHVGEEYAHLFEKLEDCY